VTNHPQDQIDENLAPKLIRRSLRLTSRLLIVVGKPFYFIFLLSLIGCLRLINITGRFLKLKFHQINIKVPKRKLAKRGIIFSSKWHKIRSSFFSRIENVKVTSSETAKKTGEFFWKTQVFFLAVEKLFYKFTNFAKSKTPKPHFPKRVLLPKIYIPRFKFFIILFTSLLLFGFVVGIFFWTIIFEDLPSPQNLITRQVDVSTKIYDRNGTVLYTIYKDKNRTPLKLEEIPLQVRLATLAIEDAEFYSHPGFSIRGIIRAIIRNIKRGELTGGSTITQQLVKNALLSPEKTLERKAREIVLAFQVEHAFSKDQILEMYLNESSYGGTAYGIQEATRMYFGKDVSKLTLGEAALLAGLPKSPTLYSPFGANPDLAFTRQKEVLHLMGVNGFITEEQGREAEQEEIRFTENTVDIKAPHFVMYTRGEIENKYGKEVVEKGGLEVITTLDYQIQKLAEKAIKEEIEKLVKLNVTNAAAVVLNPQTGEILAMVGSYDYFDIDHDGNVNVTTSLRQPGSSIKVINYAYALSHDYTPATIIKDAPVTFLVDGQPPYTPKNYEGGFRGNLTLRSAFAESRNIPAVRVLASYGVKNMMEMGQKMGITSWNDPAKFGLSLTLGGGDVRLIDLARVYATVANYGKRPNLVSTLKVTNYKGKVLDEFACKGGFQEDQLASSFNDVSAATESSLKNSEDNKSNCGDEQVLDPRVAFIITDILKDNNARAPSFGTTSMLVIPNHKEVAVKTGTSNDLRDNLTIGYNQKYLVAVWVGNNDNTPMARVASGVTGASPIFNKIMGSLLAQEPNHDWPTPKGLVQLPICYRTGTLACEGCPVKMEWFLEENAPQKACSPDLFAKEEPDNGTANEPTITPTPQLPERIEFNENNLIKNLIEKREKKKTTPN